MSAQLGSAEPSAPVIPKPDLSNVSAEVRAAANPASRSARVANPGRR